MLACMFRWWRLSPTGASGLKIPPLEALPTPGFEGLREYIELMQSCWVEVHHCCVTRNCMMCDST